VRALGFERQTASVTGRQRGIEPERTGWLRVRYLDCGKRGVRTVRSPGLEPCPLDREKNQGIPSPIPAWGYPACLQELGTASQNRVFHRRSDPRHRQGFRCVAHAFTRRACNPACSAAHAAAGYRHRSGQRPTGTRAVELVSARSHFKCSGCGVSRESY